MTTLQQVRTKIESDSDNWHIYLMDWVDDFRRDPSAERIGEGLQPSDDRWAALLASTAEHLCDETNIAAPLWLYGVPASREPWFVSGVESLKALALVQAPAHFRARKIFVLDNFLSRV